MAKEDTAPTNEMGSKVLVKPLPKILDELEGHIKSAEEAAKRAHESALLAQQAATKSIAASEYAREAGEKAAEVARQAAEEALAKAEEALVKAVVKRLARWEWITTLIVINLALIFGAVLLAFALAQAI
jgi:colicin import membrane protein